MKPNPPKAVVFDLGKVLLDFDYGLLARRVAPRCRLTAEEFRREVDQSPLLHRYETGLIDDQGFLDAVIGRSGFEGDRDELGRLFGDIFTPIPEMVDLHGRLVALGIPTYVFSNTNAFAIRHIRESYPFYAGFTGEILSFEVRSMKPDAGIYAALENLSGLRGSDLLYLDDRPENVEAGSARGWRAWLHSDPAATMPRVLDLFR
jgi:hypothetical protein